MVDVKPIGTLIGIYCECNWHPFSFNIGETAEEKAFEEWNEDFEETTRESFRDFLNEVYSKALGDEDRSMSADMRAHTDDKCCALAGMYYSEAEVLDEVLYISEELDLVLEAPTTDDDVVEAKAKKGSHKKRPAGPTSAR
jgi:hypothetical protein